MRGGAVFLAAGHEITMSLILRLINFAEAGIITDKVHVKVLVSQSQAAAGFQTN